MSPKRFWRLSFDSEAHLDEMLNSGILICPQIGPRSSKYDPDRDMQERMRKGDGIYLGRFDEITCEGVIHAIGIICDQCPATNVVWKRFSRRVLPNAGGFEPWRCRSYLFDASPASRYNLAGDFVGRFPQLIDAA